MKNNLRKRREFILSNLIPRPISNKYVAQEERNGFADQLVVGGQGVYKSDSDVIRNIRHMSVLEIIS